MINVLKHSCIKINEIYFDPFKITEDFKDAKYIFFTHSHFDHFSLVDISRLTNAKTIFIGPKDVIQLLSQDGFKRLVEVAPGKDYSANGLRFKTFPMYNVDKHYHPKENGWVGYVLDFDNEKVCVVGDSDATEELKVLKCDRIFIPISGVYTMNAREAAELVNIIKPKVATPYHYGDIVGDKGDEEVFKKMVHPTIKIETYV